MSEGYLRVVALGNLGADPELRMTKGGTAVLNIRMACSESYLDANKVKQERTEWVAVTVWGKRAEALAKILSKGDRILVEGGLRTSSYEGKDGDKRYKTEVNADKVVLCGGGKGGWQGKPASRESSPFGGDSEDSFPTSWDK